MAHGRLRVSPFASFVRTVAAGALVSLGILLLQTGVPGRVPDVDSLLDQARADIPQDQRNQLYQQAEQKIIDDEPWIPLFFSRSSYLVKPYVSGYEVPPFVIPSLRYVTVNK